MSNPVLKIVGVVVGLGCVFAFRGLGRTDINKELQKAATELNARGPIMADADTRMDRVTTGDKLLTYHYTLVNVQVSDIPDMTELNRELRTHILSRTKGAEKMKIFFKNGVTVSYRYNDKNQKLVGQVDITPKDAGY